jgi:ATP-dependent DNA helicase RecQ
MSAVLNESHHTDAAGTGNAAQRVLREVFGYAEFRGPQAAIVDHVVGGGDALVLMPTGGGKSLCFQIPAIVRHRAGRGVALVVSPLIALMRDQVGALLEAGVRAACLNSSLDPDEERAVERDFLAGRLELLYAAPERVLTPRFLAMLDSLHERGRFSLAAIDEAHCVSQWGHDFRAEYLGLAALHERWPQVPRIALTATADAHTRADIVERLALQEARVFVSSFDRPNIRYRVVEKDDARGQLLRFIREEQAGAAGIVYVQSRKRVEQTAEWLSAHGVPALPYHAGLETELRQRHQDRFVREDGLVMVATIAFGMGIDKPDVRYVAHLDLPKNIESYYQETGRAGRDGAPAEAWMCYGLADVVQQRRMIDDGAGADEFKRLQRAKLDALLAFAESLDCRRVRLLGYFGEQRGPGWRCGHCDNCLDPPRRVDATEAARKLLSCILRIERASDGLHFGAGHLIDVLRGKRTDKVAQHGHDHLSTFGCGAELDERRWRAVVRQLVALGHLVVDGGEFQTLGPGPQTRELLRGDCPVWMREPLVAAGPARPRSRAPRAEGASARPARPAVIAARDLDADALLRLAALKAWRAEVAQAHNVPAYVVFHDATLAQMAHERPASREALARISGIGASKLERYGAALLERLAAPAP